MNNGEVRSFTTRFNGISHVLNGQVGITDPTETRIKGVPGKDVHPQMFPAIWDTGATGTVITSQVVEGCNLKPTGAAKVYGVNGSHNANCYLVDVWLPNGVIITNVRAVEGQINGASVLIGMNIISLGDFAISNYRGKTTFSFRIPSLAETDYVNSHHSQNSAKSDKIGRNELCPCNSGKKYKKCCGKTKS